MSTEDVIELGSSDDEKEPVPKKKKNVPNAMVRIPNPYAKLPGLTIKPANKVAVKMQPHISSISSKINTKIANKQSPLLRKQGNRCIPIKISKPVRPLNPTTSFPNRINFGPKIKGILPGTTLLNNLPPSITVKRANDSPKRNTPHIVKPPKKKIKLVKQDTITQIQTVEIDDEETPEISATVPQWYIRPEEEVDKILTDPDASNEKAKSIKEQNNKEPSSYIEITIEDSPIKLLPSKQTVDVSSTITIEDSPVKAVFEKQGKSEKVNSQEDKQSKKKLDYPHEIPIVNNGMVEIEIDSIEGNNSKAMNDTNNLVLNTSTSQESTKCNQNTKQNNNAETKISKTEKSIQSEEFNEVYQKFIDTCFRIENSDDMKKIVDKKIKGYYKQCSKEYVDSEEFIDLVSGKILAIEASPDKLYLYIKDVVDELNMQRKLTKAAGSAKVNELTENKEYEIDRSEYDTKRQRQIRKLEKTLKKLHRAIQKLEEQEVDFDDEDDSVYLLTERYKERLVKVHAKFCQLTNTKMPSEPNIKLEPRPGRPAGPTRKVEKFINIKVPIGAPLPFPDFHDVLRCVREANNEDKLGWSEMEIIEEARDIFTTCGKKLQRRRQENEWRIAASRLPTNEDPAEKDESLKNILEKNEQLATKKVSELFNKYADRQIQLKLEGEEIGDKEAEESPVESEEEDDTDGSNLLKDKEKRKERLKRLIQEKSKSVVEKAVGVSKKQESIEAKPDEMDVDQVTEIENVSDTKEKKDNIVIDSDTDNKDNDQNELQTISDEGVIESDVDELHLLQKLYSENEANSSTVDSESESPISLSDTDEENATDNIKKSPLNTMDVISIENSSYSESDNNTDDNTVNNRNVEIVNKNNVENFSNNNMEVEILVDDSVNTEGQGNNGTDDSLISNEGLELEVEGVEKNCIENTGSYELPSIECIKSNESNQVITINTCPSSKEDCHTNKPTNSTPNCIATDSNDNVKNYTKEIKNDNSQPDKTEDNLLSIESRDITTNDYELNENILLGSSDDESRGDNTANDLDTDGCANLGDDNISISETCIGSIAANGNGNADNDTKAGPPDSPKNKNDFQERNKMAIGESIATGDDKKLEDEDADTLGTKNTEK